MLIIKEVDEVLPDSGNKALKASYGALKTWRWFGTEIWRRIPKGLLDFSHATEYSHCSYTSLSNFAYVLESSQFHCANDDAEQSRKNGLAKLDMITDY